MSTKTKIWLIIATSLVLLGSVVFVGVMTTLKWDFSKLSTGKYETNEYVINEAFNNISVVTETADVIFVPSEDTKTSVVCYEADNMKHSVAVKDGMLVIEVVDTRKWYEYIGINFATPKITVCVPQGEYGELCVKSSTGAIGIPKDFTFKSIDVSVSTGAVTDYASASELIKIKASTGDIQVENVSTASLELSVSTGKISASDITCSGDVSIKVSTGKTNLTNVKCKNLLSNGSTGDISIKNVIATEKFSVERDTGDVKLTACDAAEIYIKTDTGDVRGILLSDKAFVTKTDTGNVDVPQTSNGGKCEIITDTGDIKINIE